MVPLSIRAGYFIVVPVLFARSLGAIPANDEPENAITVPLPLPQTVQVDTTTATSNPTDPVVGCAGGATVWYRITPDFSGVLVIDAAAFSANVSVYDGVLSGPSSLVACQGPLLRGLRVPVTAGKTYLIEVSRSQGPGTLTLTFSRGSNAVPQLGSSSSPPFSMTPPAGRSGTFVITASDSDSPDDISEMRVLINSAFDSRNGCYVVWQRGILGGTVSLLDDSGLRSTSIGLGSPFQTVENSQCILYGSSGSAGFSLGLNIAFKAEFAGTKNVYASVTDIAGLTSPNFTAPLTTFTVTTTKPNSPPSIASVTPNQGTGTTQNFTFVFRDVNGADDIVTMEAIINSALDARNACTIKFSVSGSVYLLADSTSSFVFSGIPNGQCKVDSSSVSFARSGNDLTVSNVAVTFVPAFAGPKTIWGFAQDIAGQSTLMAAGTWNVPASPNSPPFVAPNSLAPTSGSGIRQVFSAQFLDPDGYADLDDARITINAGTSQANGACAVSYNAAANVLRLWNDAGAAFSVVRLGTLDVAQNSQCYLFASGSSVDMSPDGLTVYFAAAIAFKPSFAGNKNVYLSAKDRSGASSSIINAGTWTVPGFTNQSPAVVSLSPASGTARQQTFTAVFSDPNGASDLFLPEILINNALDGRLACLVLYDVLSDAFYLIDDSSSSSLRVYSRSLTQAENGQCVLYGNGSFAVNSGNTLTVTLTVVFKPSFDGARTIYVGVQDVAGLSTGLSAFGSWTLAAPANQAPKSLSATPASAAGNAQVFQFAFTDPNGYGDLVYPEVIINSALDARNGCVFIFDRLAGAVRLLNDNATGFTQVKLNSAQVAQNSSCILYGQGTLVIASGTDLVLQVNVQFRSAFAGPKQMFLFVQDRAGQSNGIVMAGTYDVQPGIP